MPLTPEEREYVVTSTVDLLRHRKRDRLLSILKDRLDRGDYPNEHERSLDEVVYAIVSTVDEKLEAGRP